ncbi:ATP-binding protein [Rhodopirellula europaea]|uniref:ATP-binding protein n=1 Tax=Rhodopirellula europaea TaxID=1263866 RepID=UPI003D266D31|tara:strand:- start:17852 stop:19483 length:1632 start_codon:yes stop_codon:yes gene_type:complete
MMTVDELNRLLQEPEGENLEFKKAENKFGTDELTKYCVALANERGGRIVFGVTDKRQRRVTGTTAFAQPEQARKTVLDRLKISITFDVIEHPDGRVVVFTVASRPTGVLLQYDGQFWERHGDALVGMELTSGRAREITAELGTDFSASIVDGLTLADLDGQAIANFQNEWIEFTGNERLRSLTSEQVLRDIEGVTEDGVTYAALILFGTRPAIRKHLAQSEIVFEYRSSEAAGPAAQRENLTDAFFNLHDQVWKLVNLRNDQQPYQDDLAVRNVPTFDERAVREGVLNAVCHRHYQMAGNIFLRQYSDQLVIESPGGFLPEITPENILNRQSPRNRRVAEILQLCGLVERSGQGVDLMYERSIRQSKPHPDFTGSDESTVVLRLSGRMLDPSFVRFLGTYVPAKLDELGTDDWLALSRIASEQPLTDSLQLRVDNLLSRGLIERVDGGRFILPRIYYQFHDRGSVYDRLRQREQQKEKVEQVLDSYRIDGVAISDLNDSLPEFERANLRRLLQELQVDGRVHTKGEKRWMRYFPGPAEGNGES